MPLNIIPEWRDSLIANLGPVRLFIIAFAISACVYIYASKAANSRRDIEFGNRNGCKPPPKLAYKWPFALDILRQGFKAGRDKRLLALFTKFFDQLGTTAEVSILGGRGIVTQDPENIEALLSTQFEDFHLGPRSLGFRAMVGDGIFTQDGPAWKHSRELLRKQFVRMQYQNLEGFREHLENMIERLNQSSGITDLQPVFYRMTLDTTIAMILGQPVESFKHEIGDQFSRSFDKASLVTATRIRLGDMYWIYVPKGFFAACKSVKAYVSQFVADTLHRKETSDEVEEKFSFIADLYQDYRDLDRVRDQVINVLIAGRDTTAATMSYALSVKELRCGIRLTIVFSSLLLQNPHTLKLLRQEIETVVGDEKHITRSHIQRMPYLQNVLKESELYCWLPTLLIRAKQSVALRLFPPVPINSRFCKTTTTLPTGGGPDGRSPVLVREGEPVAYSVYHMQRREDLYGPEPLSFQPQRWDQSKLSSIGWAYLPFNGGPRVCLEDFGLMLASCGIIRVIQEFPDLRLAPGEASMEPGTERQHLTLVLSNAGGCKALLH